jgi:3-hydroxymyristoyl/3-hydroxydecanoyl-(acyl carrier protein) dehydratase
MISKVIKITYSKGNIFVTYSNIKAYFNYFGGRFPVHGANSPHVPMRP